MKTKQQTSIRFTFLIIQAMVGFLLVFLLIQAGLLWRVCRQGVQTTAGLEKEGIPSMVCVAKLQQNLNLYRLRSFEMMFVQEKDRLGKARETDALHQQNSDLLVRLNRLFPAGQGHDLVAIVDTNLVAYVSTVGRLRTKMEKEFEAAMRILDDEIPAKVATLDQSVMKLSEFCDDLAFQRIQETVGGFGKIKANTFSFGTASTVFAAIVLVLVMLNSGRIQRQLSFLVNQLHEGANQVNNSGNATASASQSLAEGANKQAASLEETSASLEELASVTKRNAENAQRTNELARQARNAAERGSKDMEAMSSAMQDIKVSSDDVAKIIKTIDEIAFQTNILALNAAVEAARAGDAGMGFAVVADEVRALAQRSAQAAKETTEKIEGAIAKTGLGVGISSKVAAALSEIVTKAREVDELAAQVAGASQQQTQGIAQINHAVGEMDRVTQSNAAVAEESAAAAEQLKLQANQMKQSFAELLALVGAKNSAGPTGDSPRAVPGEIPAKEENLNPAGLAQTFRSRNLAHPATPATTVRNGLAGRCPTVGDFKDF